MPVSPRRAGASSPWRFSTAGRTLIENANVRSLEQRTSRLGDLSKAERSPASPCCRAAPLANGRPRHRRLRPHGVRHRPPHRTRHYRRRAELSGRSVLHARLGSPPAVLPAAQDNNPASGSLSVSVSIGATIKNSAIRAPCVGANQCHCAIARPWCTQRLAIPSADRESGDARGWIRYFHQCLGERNGARDWRKRREQNGPSLSAPESDLSAQNLF
jgi:hypothetical protein